MLSDRDYTRAPFRSAPPRVNDTVLKPLILVNVAVFALQILSRHSLTQVISLDFGSLLKGEIWRLGTHLFAHGGFGHILFNMWGLWIFGQVVEQRIGGHRLLQLYLLSGLVAAGTWLLFNSTPRPVGMLGLTVIKTYPSVLGASGALFGILVAAAILDPNRMFMLLIPPIPMRLKTLAIVYGCIELIAIFNQQGSNIAHLAHVGGMLGGYLYVRWLFRGRWANASRSGPGSWRMPKTRRSGWNPFASRPRQTPPPPPKPFPGSDGPMNEIDAILDKIGKHGLGSLTEQERRVLQEVREKLKQQKSR